MPSGELLRKFSSQATVPPPCTFLFHCPHHLLMKSSELRLHNRCRDLSCVILGGRPVFPFIDNSTTTLPNGALCGSHYKTGRREGRLGVEGSPCRGGLVTSSVLPAATGGGARGCRMRMPGKSHFYEAFPWSPRSPGGEGSSASAHSAGFLTVQPVSGQTRCDRSKALQRMGLATLLRAESGQPPRWGCGRPRERRSKRRHSRHLGLVLYTLRDSG